MQPPCTGPWLSPDTPRFQWTSHRQPDSPCTFPNHTFQTPPALCVGIWATARHGTYIPWRVCAKAGRTLWRQCPGRTLVGNSGPTHHQAHPRQRQKVRPSLGEKHPHDYHLSFPLCVTSKKREKGKWIIIHWFYGGRGINCTCQQCECCFTDEFIWYTHKR
jgi:hypothetical protein